MNQKVNNCLSCPLNCNCFFILVLYMSAFEARPRPRPAHSHQLLILGCVLMTSSDLHWLIPQIRRTHHQIQYLGSIISSYTVSSELRSNNLCQAAVGIGAHVRTRCACVRLLNRKNRKRSYWCSDILLDLIIKIL